eukprot:TRINITY_DN25134_c0_g1_i1.p1 TRINITY_DN25134_c0_g1~~TRINITY_DN25134_c0_g1_i1.p1  ORF type:complete len:561 (+),score=75.81 TRINITY_DN25134_c0_g1_i1:49-1731(+)
MGDSFRDNLDDLTNIKPEDDIDDVERRPCSKSSVPSSSSRLKGTTPGPRSAWGLYCMYGIIGLVNGFFASYINVPFCQYVFGPMNDPGRTTTQQCAVASTIVQMPWNFKVFYGLFLDRFTFFGSRRRGWIIFGWVAGFAILLLLATFSQSIRDSDNFALYTLMLMLMEVFLIVADVAGDGMTIELTKHEPEETRGYILTTGQLMRFTMRTIVQTIGMVFMNGPEYYLETSKNSTALFQYSLSFWQIHVVIFCLAMPFFVGMIYFLEDPPDSGEDRSSTSSFSKTFQGIWTLLKTKVCFLLICFNVINIAIASMGNPASNVISLIATPTTLQTSVGGLLGNLFFMGGVLLFRRYFLNRNWRFTLIWTTAFLIVVSLLALMTIYNTWGVGQDGWFFILTGTIPDFIAGIAQVLSSLAVAEISPSGAEAFTYEFFSTIHNCAIALNINFSNLFVPVFALGDISLENYITADAAQKQSYNTNMANATYVSLGINVAGLLACMWMLPKDKRETHKWLSDKMWHKPSVACIGLSVATATFLFSTVASFLSLFPGTMCMQIAGGSGC